MNTLLKQIEHTYIKLEQFRYGFTLEFHTIFEKLSSLKTEEKISGKVEVTTDTKEKILEKLKDMCDYTKQGQYSMLKDFYLDLLQSRTQHQPSTENFIKHEIDESVLHELYCLISDQDKDIVLKRAKDSLLKRKNLNVKVNRLELDGREADLRRYIIEVWQDKSQLPVVRSVKISRRQLLEQTKNNYQKLEQDKHVLSCSTGFYQDTVCKEKMSKIVRRLFTHQKAFHNDISIQRTYIRLSKKLDLSNNIESPVTYTKHWSVFDVNNSDSTVERALAELTSVIFRSGSDSNVISTLKNVGLFEHVESTVERAYGALKNMSLRSESDSYLCSTLKNECLVDAVKIFEFECSENNFAQTKVSLAERRDKLKNIMSMISNNNLTSSKLRTDYVKHNEVMPMVVGILNQENVKLNENKHYLLGYKDIVLNVILAQVFEDALRASSVQSFSLDVTYLHHRDCTYVIGLPIYKGGYISMLDLQESKELPVDTAFTCVNVCCFLDFISIIYV
ncbi:uncharacterized protein LOC127853788 isoform X1 [Dreissena polymorpha]|uniref:uncharacterized protein LOC127853788 isoform X1 n=1 Tax=Dreissena polymorpha TaxID=45954 RepID=UPI00226523ED|nr:uncharacterized protein LOC127853788 isoform X1 [Dreissena polymorpha]XP_052244516.1 uncharacterized protein LOC127853788 isoform X1 [Dreissena polymorpha]